MRIELRYKDIDPDSGDISQDELMCLCLNLDIANWLKIALEENWYGENGPCDPNREFYITVR